MSIFGWIAAGSEPPEQWDLRRRGWTLCDGAHHDRAECCHVLIADVRELDSAARRKLSAADRPSYRVIMRGVEVGAERAHLLTHGCAEVLAEETDLAELEVRARRVTDMFSLLPRWRTVGPLTLDLFHRDARCGARWLVLHPREFGVLWRLSDDLGAVVSRRELLHDVWRISQDPETNSVEVHVSRLRGKLAAVGYASLIETAPQGGYRLASGRTFMFADESLPDPAAVQTYSLATASPRRSRSR